MNIITDTSPMSYNQSQLQTSASQLFGDMAASTITTIPPDIKRPHDNTVVSVEQNLLYRIPNPKEKFGKFSASLLKNKVLLVPTRLALKRQRAFPKPPTKKLESVYSGTLQMELGNPEEFSSPTDRNDDELNMMISQSIHLSPEQNRTQLTSNHTSSLQENTPHTVPTDISLMYREKPLFSHPVTGNFIVQDAGEKGGPSPCSYVLPRKSCREKNAPAYTFGSRCSVEKKGGSRTAWEKQWFAHSDPYTIKVDFNREAVWPTPFHYPAKPTFGTQITKFSSPSWSIASRFQTNATTTSENNPSPDAYDTISAFKKLTSKNTHITLKSQPGGARVSTIQAAGRTPGPNAYDETKFLSNKCSAPKYSFGRHTSTSFGHHPHIKALPSIEI